MNRTLPCLDRLIMGGNGRRSHVRIGEQCAVPSVLPVYFNNFWIVWKVQLTKDVNSSGQTMRVLAPANPLDVDGPAAVKFCGFCSVASSLLASPW